MKRYLGYVSVILAVLLVLGAGLYGVSLFKVPDQTPQPDAPFVVPADHCRCGQWCNCELEDGVCVCGKPKPVKPCPPHKPVCPHKPCDRPLPAHVMVGLMILIGPVDNVVIVDWYVIRNHFGNIVEYRVTYWDPRVDGLAVETIDVIRPSPDGIDDSVGRGPLTKVTLVGTLSKEGLVWHLKAHDGQDYLLTMHVARLNRWRDGDTVEVTGLVGKLTPRNVKVTSIKKVKLPSRNW